MRSANQAYAGAPPRSRQERIGVALHPREPRLHHRDQRQHCGERQLKADAEDRLRFDRDDGEDREGEIAHGERPPVHDDGAQHDQRHHQRPLGADPRAGGDVVEDRADHRHDGRPFLDRISQRQRRRQRKQAPRHDEEDPSDQRHLHAGNRDDVKDARFADQVLGVVRQEVALSGDHGGGDRPLVAADDGVDAQGEAVAGMVDAGGKTLAPGRIVRRRQKLDAAERRTDSADAGEEGVAGKIIPARQRRARRRQEPRLEPDIVACGDVRRPARGDPHAARSLVARHAFRARDRDHHARADGPEIHLLHVALETDDADAVEHRRGDAQSAQGHRQKSGEQGSQRERHAERQRPGARNPGKRGEDRRQPGRKPENRFAVGCEVEPDAAHRRNRQPEEEAPLLDLLRQRGSKGLAPVRRRSSRARKAAGGRRENARAHAG